MWERHWEGKNFKWVDEKNLRYFKKKKRYRIKNSGRFTQKKKKKKPGLDFA